MSMFPQTAYLDMASAVQATEVSRMPVLASFQTMLTIWRVGTVLLLTVCHKETRTNGF